MACGVQGPGFKFPDLYQFFIGLNVSLLIGGPENRPDRLRRARKDREALQAESDRRGRQLLLPSARLQAFPPNRRFRRRVPLLRHGPHFRSGRRRLVAEKRTVTK